MDKGEKGLKQERRRQMLKRAYAELKGRDMNLYTQCVAFGSMTQAANEQGLTGTELGAFVEGQAILLVLQALRG